MLEDKEKLDNNLKQASNAISNTYNNVHFDVDVTVNEIHLDEAPKRPKPHKLRNYCFIAGGVAVTLYLFWSFHVFDFTQVNHFLSSKDGAEWLGSFFRKLFHL